MQPRSSANKSALGRSRRLLLSAGLPLLLALAFIVRQFSGFDSIGWHNGFSHPLIGWDHLVTMLAVGIWAAQLRGQAIWMLPLAFVGVMSVGGLVGAAGIVVPSVEGIILLSCAVFSVLITRNIRFNSKVNVMIVAFFAFFHGYAHGQEISTSASLISYTLGFMLATLLLHGAGILVAKLVVLAVTCLLAALFSQAALAKQAESVFGDHGTVAMVDTMPTPSSGYAGLPLYGGGPDLLSACDELDFRSPNASDSGGGLSNASDTVLRDVDQAATSNVASRPDAMCWPRATAVDADAFGQFAIEPEPTAARVFKHYFPDINHTPGKSLLCNGVGLTSPPTAGYLVSSPLVSRSFSHSPIDRTEAFRLRAMLANTPFGNIHSDFNLDFSPEAISFKPKPVPAPVVLSPSGTLSNLVLDPCLVRYRNDKPLRVHMAVSAPERSSTDRELNRLKPLTFLDDQL